LRRWPREHPPVSRLQFIQAVLWHVHQEGFRRVPLPLETSRHGGYVTHAGHLWEVAPWMPGQADYHQRPSPRRLQAAMQALGEFHAAASSFPLSETSALPSPGIAERFDRLRQLESGELMRIKRSLRPDIWPELAQRGERLISLFPLAAPRVAALLREAGTIEAPLIPCIRDIWHDHVLFEEEQVSALIDFGALRPENAAGDIARLLGSLVGDDLQGWSTGLAAYEAIRPLMAAERRLVVAFDASGVLLSGLNWLEWIFVEGRQFSARRSILSRVDAAIGRLAQLVASGPGA
jgi:Ser/Thr protein kinase RdoA (MazF antagonist)